MVESEQYWHSSPTIVEGSPDIVNHWSHTGSYDSGHLQQAIGHTGYLLLFLCSALFYESPQNWGNYEHAQSVYQCHVNMWTPDFGDPWSPKLYTFRDLSPNVHRNGDPFIDLGTPAYMNGVPITIYNGVTPSPKLHRYGDPYLYKNFCVVFLHYKANCSSLYLSLMDGQDDLLLPLLFFDHKGF